MDCKEGLPTNRAPLFDGTNYATWSIRMRTYLMALGFDICHCYLHFIFNIIHMSGIKQFVVCCF
jgi:glycine cleavage system protein P-like pyridoxal-binding family